MTISYLDKEHEKEERKKIYEHLKKEFPSENKTAKSKDSIDAFADKFLESKKCLDTQEEVDIDHIAPYFRVASSTLRNYSWLFKRLGAITDKPLCGRNHLYKSDIIKKIRLYQIKTGLSLRDFAKLVKENPVTEETIRNISD